MKSFEKTNEQIIIDNIKESFKEGCKHYVGRPITQKELTIIKKEINNVLRKIQFELDIGS